MFDLIKKIFGVKESYNNEIYKDEIVKPWWVDTHPEDYDIKIYKIKRKDDVKIYTLKRAKDRGVEYVGMKWLEDNKPI